MSLFYPFISLYYGRRERPFDLNYVPLATLQLRARHTSVANAVQLCRFWYKLEALVQFGTFLCHLWKFLGTYQFLRYIFGLIFSFSTRTSVPSFSLWKIFFLLLQIFNVSFRRCKLISCSTILVGNLIQCLSKPLATLQHTLQPYGRRL